MKLIVTIPAFNEEKTIGSVIEGIPKRIRGIDSVQAIVVDDGSTDNTAKIAKQKGAIVVHNIGNKGLAFSFKRGLEEALARGADIIVNTDADNQYDQGQIPLLVKPVLDGRAELVLGSRFSGSIEHMPLQKRLGNRIASSVLGFVTGKSVSDGQTGFRAFSREAALQMSLYSTYTYTHETLMQAVEKKIVVKEVPVAFRKRPDKSRLISSIWGYAWQAAKIFYNYYVTYKPLLFFNSIAALFFASGLIVGARPVTSFLETGLVAFIPSAILAVALVIISILFFLSGLEKDVARHNRLLQEELLYRQKKSAFSK